MIKQRIVLFWFLFAGFLPYAGGQVTGRVTDETGMPLIGANLLLLPDSVYGTTDTVGQFTLDTGAKGPFKLQVSYIGYESKTLEIKAGGQENFRIFLETSTAYLETVEVTEEHAKLEATLPTEHVSRDFLAENIQGNFVQTLERLPGLNAINVGVGIAKPVIRGLSANRIIVNDLGIKQESQQWGSDHGLEIDQFGVDRVELIKGPASLQYGSDGLGGVINIMPNLILPKNSLKGGILGVYKTNNQHLGGSAFLKVNIDDFFVDARYSLQTFADYRVPADAFTYNSFTLPIYDNRLKNTAGREESRHLTIGLSRDWGITRLNYSLYSLDAGLFSGAVGIPRSYGLNDDGNRRDLDVPRQEVEHHKLSLEQTLIFGEDHLNFTIGYQANFRKEFSFPEFHSIPTSLIDPNNTLALQLDLQTYSGNMHYEHYASDGTKLIFGGNAQWQENRRGGFEFLLPDFQTFRAGTYVLGEKQWGEHLVVNAGLRYDLARNQTMADRQFVWNSNEVIVDSLVAPPTDDWFHNWSASMGASFDLAQRYNLKLNIGKSFRVPYPSETVSNGIHHGTFRHEVGQPDLQTEQGYQFDFSLTREGNRFSARADLFFNYFQNYIYLGPTFPARFSPLPEAGQIFRYRQDNALFTGGELSWEWTARPWLSLKQAGDLVQSLNTETRLALPFTPQPALRHTLTFRLPSNKWQSDWKTWINYDYIFAAEGRYRIDRSEQPTPAYSLIHLGLSGNLLWQGQIITLQFRVQNLLDTAYLNHLSRYRILNIPEQGRNFILSLNLPFTAQLKG